VDGLIPAGNEQGSAGGLAGDQAATLPPVIVSLRRLDWIADVEADSARSRSSRINPWFNSAAGVNSFSFLASPAVSVVL
jgi:hypothetical protein